MRQVSDDEQGQQCDSSHLARVFMPCCAARCAVDAYCAGRTINTLRTVSLVRTHVRNERGPTPVSGPRGTPAVIGAGQGRQSPLFCAVQFGAMSAALGGFDCEEVVRALGCTENRIFRVWHAAT